MSLIELLIDKAKICHIIHKSQLTRARLGKLKIFYSALSQINFFSFLFLGFHPSGFWGRQVLTYLTGNGTWREGQAKILVYVS